MVFEIKKFKNDENAELHFSVCLICLGVIFTIGLIISLLLLMAKKKKLAILSILISIIIIISIVGFIYYDIYSRPNEIEYKLIVKTNQTGEYTLYVPYLDNSELKSKLKVSSGNGKIEFINIEEMPINGSKNAMKIFSNNSVKISGKAQSHSWPDMSLKTFEQSKKIYAYWLWCNNSNPNQNISIIIKVKVSGYWKDDSWRIEPKQNNDVIYIENGWNKIFLRLSVSVV